VRLTAGQIRLASAVLVSQVQRGCGCDPVVEFPDDLTPIEHPDGTLCIEGVAVYHVEDCTLFRIMKAGNN
jgi:hypothetical protein